MKYLILIVLSLLIFSCKESTVKINTDLPIEVVKLKEVNKFDTLYSISNTKQTFLFDKNKEYLGSFDKEYTDLTFVLLICIVMILILIIIINVIND